MELYDVVIVGAGIAGLSCAREVKNQDKSVLVLDKGRGVGGRLATRRLDGAVLDHGAQYFTVRDERFAAMIREFEHAGVVAKWTTGYVNDDGSFSPHGEDRYRGVPTMNAIARHLSHGLDVRTGVKVVRFEQMEDRWIIEDSAGERHSARSLVLTPPAPQVVELLESSQISAGRDAIDRLHSVSYTPCICLLAVSDDPHPLPGPGVVQLSRGPIRWIADNQRKGVSPDRPALTIHAAGEWSAEHYGDSDEKICALLTDSLRPWLHLDNAVLQVKRWRYARSRPSSRGKGLPDVVDLETRIPAICAGDGYSAPRVEAATLSGVHAAEWLSR